MNQVRRTGPSLVRITLSNLLSFGPDPVSLHLPELTLLIGPNGSGKSNLIEAISLMRSTAVPGTARESDLRGVVRRGGGAREWLWKGRFALPATLELTLLGPKIVPPLQHKLVFNDGPDGSLQLEDEQIEGIGDDVVNFYSFRKGRPILRSSRKRNQKLSPESLDLNASILSQRRDPEQFPEIASLADFYEQVRIYREWAFGRNTIYRSPQRADMRSDRLEEDFCNLALFLSRLRRTPRAKAEIVEGLQELYDGVTDFDVIVEGGTVQLFLTEGDFSIPATRLSDGTLRYLALLAILCDPTPPPLVCIEEPELGLHPDILPKLADRLVDASRRMQLIVTTHSDVLVDAMTERPETVVVCEKHEGVTSLQRLAQRDLEAWLESYRLGGLWIKGHIGGTRW